MKLHIAKLQSVLSKSKGSGSVSGKLSRQLRSPGSFSLTNTLTKEKQKQLLAEQKNSSPAPPPPLSKETLSAFLPLQVCNSNDGVGVEGSRGGEQKVVHEKGRTDLSSEVDHFFPETVHHSTKQPEVMACRCLEKEKTSKNENKNPRLNQLTTFCKMFRSRLIL